MAALVRTLSALCWLSTAATQSSWNHTGYDLRRMLLAESDEYLYVLGESSAYQLRTSNLSLVATYAHPVGALTVAFNNDPDTVTTCSNGTDQCMIHPATNITEPLPNLTRIKIRSAKAAVGFVDNNLFIACPHWRDQTESSDDQDFCSSPGISWRRFINEEKRFTEKDQFAKYIKMKKLGETPIETVQFIKVFVVDKHILFFSQQQASGGRYTTRVAQLCNTATEIGYTYVDMEIHCGERQDNMLMTDVTKFVFNDSVYVAAVFNSTSRVASAVCVFPFSQLRDRLIQNFRDCYAANQTEYEDYLISRHRCNTRTTIPDDLLCAGYGNAFNVIGTYSLDASPVLEFNVSIQSIAVVEKGSEIVAFLGTAENGQIFKAVVHPPSSARKLPFSISLGYRKSVRGDMYISPDKTHLLAMTNSMVARVPLWECSNAGGCQECLGGRDPSCGWCLLENKCSTREDCATVNWFPASDIMSKCPTILSINQPYIPADRQENLEIVLSHWPTVTSFSCHFHFVETTRPFSRTSTAAIGDDTVTREKHLRCQSPDIQPIIHEVNGTLVMNLSILSNMSTEPFVKGHLTYYSCESFTQCSQCAQEVWQCEWCLYQESCHTPNASDCSGTKKVPHTQGGGLGACPNVTSGDISPWRKNSGIYFLSNDSAYTVTMMGENFPEPTTDMGYTCHAPSLASADLAAVYLNESLIQCFISKTHLSQGRVESKLHLNWGSSPLPGWSPKVTFYNCEMLESSCGKCKSFAEYNPYLECRWCSGLCISKEHDCTQVQDVCPAPRIDKVYPLNAAVNTSIVITITGTELGSNYNDTVNAITVGELECFSIQELYLPATNISCKLEASLEEMVEKVKITLPDQGPVFTSQSFQFRVPQVLGIFPILGPKSGGTLLTVRGQYLVTGSQRAVFLGNQPCDMESSGPTETGNLTCKTRSIDLDNQNEKTLEVIVQYENSSKIVGTNVSYSYIRDPEVTDIRPRESFMNGGRRLTVTGTNLHSIQAPKVYATFNNERQSNEAPCERYSDTVIYCDSPMANSTIEKPQRRRRDVSFESARLSFVMDGVMSVRNLDENICTFKYYDDPVIHEFQNVERYHDVLVIKGERLAIAANQEDVVVFIGTAKCNVTSLKNNSIYCNPPAYSEIKTSQSTVFPIKVQIGNFKTYVGFLEYALEPQEGDLVTVVAGAIVAVVVFVLVVVLFILWRTCKKRHAASKERKGLEYKMDKLEAACRTQCREEFAALQMAVSDLTNDLEGGNVLFRDYHVYACKTLFTTTRAQNTIMSQPPEMTKMHMQALDNLKALTRNTNFLLMFIRTLEKQTTFSIKDKSHLATCLMVLNHDNLEFITDILKAVLNDLVDKNMASQTPKLMLRRSESVSEKLLTHWLSICLYHYLKDSSGSALYILYKAIKTQVEKGPVDYITSCAKYTLSEERLFTSVDTATNVKTVVMQVTHFHYIDNEEKQISAAMLDCDTITQAKSKMLEILYKNIPYSQRPPVHKTMLQIQEEDGTERTLNDEDASSIKDGLWKKINTLQHYGITDGCKATLIHSKELAFGSTNLAEATPDAYIVGSYRKSRPAIRTISGSNYWHLTKQDIGENEVKISSDFFLPRLINTKGTLQTFIDDLFVAILTAGEEPPIIIKYLYDFLDGAAARHGVTDPEVLHTWKCNSVLLRFWVNILKNPEFVFDIHKPQIVDSCLSVVAQTLMDSCSTADLTLGTHSPSNKLLFAKDIPRYKKMVQTYFEDIKNKPPVSDQDLNSYLTERVSQKFSGDFNMNSALMEIYKYAAQYKGALINEMDNLEASSPGSYFPLSSKLEAVCACMEMK